jgi:hypothetical protein
MDGAAHAFSLVGNSAMTRARSGSLIDPQRAISSSVRPQPEQRPVAGAMTQTLMQGESINPS